jgi:hypothetical protein
MSIPGAKAAVEDLITLAKQFDADAEALRLLIKEMGAKEREIRDELRAAGDSRSLNWNFPFGGIAGLARAMFDPARAGQPVATHKAALEAYASLNPVDKG